MGKSKEIANILPQKKEVTNVESYTLSIITESQTLSESIVKVFGKSTERIARESAKLGEYNEKRNAFAEFVSGLLFSYYQSAIATLSKCEKFGTKKSASEMKRLRESLKGCVEDSQIDAIVSRSCGQSAKQINLEKQFAYFLEKNEKKQFLSSAEFANAFNKSVEELKNGASEIAKKEYTEKRIKKALEDAQSIFGTLDKKQSDAIKKNTRDAIAKEIANGEISF